MPYQPRERLPDSLGTAHIHYVGLATGLSGFVVPSRLYGILAAGRPVIVAADPTVRRPSSSKRSAAASRSRPTGPNCWRP